MSFVSTCLSSNLMSLYGLASISKSVEGCNFIACNGGYSDSMISLLIVFHVLVYLF